MAVRLDPEEVETRIIHQLVSFDDKDVFEIGCGDGRLTMRFAHEAASVLAVDPKEEKIAIAKKRTPNSLKSIVSFRVADISSMDVPERAYDLAVISWSL